MKSNYSISFDPYRFKVLESEIYDNKITMYLWRLDKQA